MNNIDRIINDIPDHEQRANSFINDVENLAKIHPQSLIKAWSSASTAMPLDILNALEKETPGIKDKILQEEHLQEIESLDKSTADVLVVTMEREVFLEAEEKIADFAKNYSATESATTISKESQKNIRVELLRQAYELARIQNIELPLIRPEYWSFRTFEFV